METRTEGDLVNDLVIGGVWQADEQGVAAQVQRQGMVL